MGIGIRLRGTNLILIFMKVYKKYFLEGVKKAKGVVIIVDIFRACSTASYLLGNGVDKIIAVRTSKQAFELKKKNPKYILIGENRGIKIKGFDFGNSPTEINKFNLSGKTIVFRTSSGTQGIVCAKNASEIILGSFTTADATRNYLRKTNPKTVTIVCLGDSIRNRNSEDWLYADYLENEIKGRKTVFDKIKNCIRKSKNARPFFDPFDLSFPKEDFEYCLTLDKFNFIMKAEKEEEQIVIRKI